MGGFQASSSAFRSLLAADKAECAFIVVASGALCEGRARTKKDKERFRMISP